MSERIIPLTELGISVAKATGCTPEEGIHFIKTLFDEVSRRLIAGKKVELAGIGTFGTVDGSVIFAPATELAEAINQPFAAFEAVELNEGFTLEDDSLPDSKQKQDVPADDEDENITTADATENDEIPDAATEPGTIESDEIDHEPAIITQPDDEPESPEPHRHRAVIWPWVGIVAMVAGFIVGHFTAPRHPYPETEESESVISQVRQDLDQASTPLPLQEEQDSCLSDTVASEKVVTPPPAVITDTVRHNRYLTTMAREHYKQMEYWVYIYQENQSKLANPDRIEPGTVLVIPPADKYGLHSGDEAKIHEAMQLAAKIYAPYR